jgi:signal transduction histidine kinase
VDVILERRDCHVVLIIEDDGIGGGTPPTPSSSGGMGIIGMSERVSLIGGALEIESAPDKGTTLFVRVPAVLAEEGEA